MKEQMHRLRSARSLTDFLHMVGIAAPIFFILLGCYLLYENLVPNPFVKVSILLTLLIAVAVVAPLGSRLKNLKFTEHGMEIQPFSAEPYSISFEEIEHCSISSVFNIVKLRIGATHSLPADSVWFIPEQQDGQSRSAIMVEVHTLLTEQLHTRSKDT